MFQSARKLTRRGTVNASVEPSTGSSSFITIPTPASPEPLGGHSQTNHSSDGVADSDYAKRCKALMELDRELRKLGADMFFDLPHIAVIGAQSAGKSSLIEAVSGINVPRDSGICTRCPVELSMSSVADEWKCKISLRIEYDPSGAQQGGSTNISFCTLSFNEKDNVDLWLRRAQASILCRERPVSDFQDMTLEELKRLKPGEGSMLFFSMNVIEVHLEDPEATDLTFIDLPGLIQNVSDEKEITVARDLVKKNIQGTKTLILVTIPMSDEMENQEAARLAKSTDPSGDRTIGVLTKPDTITPGAIGSRQRWKDILQGKIYPLRHGYYCVRLADDDERALKLLRAQSELLSDGFFAKTEPWNGFEDRSRFGVPNFVKDISRLLVGMIESNLPKLKVAVDQLISDCSNELNTMPQLPTREPSTEILLRISDFCREVHEAVMGKDHKSVVQRNKCHYQTFKAAIERTNPDLWPVPSKAYYSNPGMHVEGGSVGPFDLFDVRKEIAKSITWELPGFVPFDAIKGIVLMSTSMWRGVTVECFDSVFQSTSAAIEALVTRHFKQFTKLQTLIKSSSRLRLNHCKVEAMSLIEKLLRHESVPLYTQNIEYFTTQKSNWLRKYTDIVRDIDRNPSRFVRPPKAPRPSLRGAPAPYPPSRQPSPAPSGSPSYSPPSSGASSPDALASILPSVTYEDELLVMATVSAYFQVASKRFIDHIPLAIEHQLNQVFSETIHEVLVEEVMSGTDVPRRMKELLSEDEDIAERRRFLEQRLTRLREIRETIAQYEAEN
ncbi:P-loop containing nucleoside triphosphate hydrolase protein [Rhodocollybia butyracea]|uniref:P-loop containing nucleoside triphosphate hydrolase protein n=1 Tax=Rhodocollybia butyracea TaxID=206335 RepID=A0A9P5UGB1_9AGAR|nr:P-loop containing nucleoside triphosphate hydrolase protein [Rhodocollybia butyracea]